MAVDHNNPQSRDEEILIATIDGTEYNKNPQSRMEELLLELKETIEEGGGGGGTTDYENLSNQPQVNGETLIGDKSGADLGLVDAEEGKGLSTNDYDDTEKAAVAAATSAISAMQDGSEIDSFGDVEVALLDKADISDLGTAAAKDSTNVVTSGSTDLVESGAVKDAIDAAVSRAYHHAGTKTVAQLTHDLLIAANEGNVYEITDSGTTTSDFMEGIGKPIKEGDNVGIAKISDGVYKFDLLSGFVDTTNFVQKSVTAGLLQNDGTVDTTIQGDVATLKSGFTTLDNEVNGDATTYPYADVITIEDAVPANLAECNVKIEPVQDLHGYDKPWVGGAGKNLLDTSTVTVGGVTFTEGADGYVSCADGDGRSWSYANCQYKLTLPSGNYKFVVETKTVGSTGKGCVFKDSSGNDILSINSANLFAEVGVVAYDFTLSAETSFGAEIKHGGAVARFMIVSSTVANTWQPYENICPISGHTEASVQRDGNDVWTGNDSYTIASAGHVIPNTTIALPAGTYALDFEASNPSGAFEFEVFKGNSVDWSNRLFDKVFTTKARNIVKFTLTEASTNLRLYSTAGASISNVRLFSTVQTYTIALGDTIYGGTVDFDSGVMTVDRQLLVIDENTQNMSLHNTSDSTAVFKIITGQECINDARQKSNMFTHDTNGWNSDIAKPCFVMGQEGNLYIQVPLTLASTVSDFITWLASNNVQIFYPLKDADITTIQLTPQQIQLLKGTNTLTASTGQISVTANGVSGSIGAVQEQVNELAEDVAEIKPVNYSTTEQKTGQKWIDNSDIWFKTVDIGALPNRTYKDVQTGITNVKDICKIEGITTNETIYTVIPHGANTASYGVELSFNKQDNTVRVSTSEDQSTYTGIVTLYYTKTT